MMTSKQLYSFLITGIIVVSLPSQVLAQNVTQPTVPTTEKTELLSLETALKIADYTKRLVQNHPWKFLCGALLLAEYETQLLQNSYKKYPKSTLTTGAALLAGAEYKWGFAQELYKKYPWLTLSVAGLTSLGWLLHAYEYLDVTEKAKETYRVGSKLAEKAIDSNPITYPLKKIGTWAKSGLGHLWTAIDNRPEISAGIFTGPSLLALDAVLAHSMKSDGYANFLTKTAGDELSKSAKTAMLSNLSGWMVPATFGFWLLVIKGSAINRFMSMGNDTKSEPKKSSADDEKIVYHGSLQKDLDSVIQALKKDSKKAPRSILLDGVTGTGKSHLGQIIAKEFGATVSNGRFTKLDASQVVRTRWGGVGSERVGNAFDEGIDRARNDPLHLHFILVDEIHAMAGQRSGSEDGVGKDSQNTAENFRTSIEEANKVPNLIIIGTTNYTDAIDPAIKNQFKFRTTINPPDMQQRYKLIEGLITDNGCSATVDTIFYIAQNSQELTGRDIKNLVETICSSAHNYFESKFKDSYQKNRRILINRQVIRSEINDLLMKKLQIKDKDYREWVQKTKNPEGVKFYKDGLTKLNESRERLVKDQTDYTNSTLGKKLIEAVGEPTTPSKDIAQLRKDYAESLQQQYDALPKTPEQTLILEYKEKIKNSATSNDVDTNLTTLANKFDAHTSNFKTSLNLQIELLNNIKENYEQYLKKNIGEEAKEYYVERIQKDLKELRKILTFNYNQSDADQRILLPKIENCLRGNQQDGTIIDALDQLITRKTQNDNKLRKTIGKLSPKVQKVDDKNQKSLDQRVKTVCKTLDEAMRYNVSLTEEEICKLIDLVDFKENHRDLTTIDFGQAKSKYDAFSNDTIIFDEASECAFKCNTSMMDTYATLMILNKDLKKLNPQEFKREFDSNYKPIKALVQKHLPPKSNDWFPSIWRSIGISDKIYATPEEKELTYLTFALTNCVKGKVKDATVDEEKVFQLSCDILKSQQDEELAFEDWFVMASQDVDLQNLLMKNAQQKYDFNVIKAAKLKNVERKEQKIEYKKANVQDADKYMRMAKAFDFTHLKRK